MMPQMQPMTAGFTLVARPGCFSAFAVGRRRLLAVGRGMGSQSPMALT